MREIKFRAWSKKAKKIMMGVENMYDSLGEWFDNHGNEIDPYNGFQTASFGQILEDTDCVVMQFTGLKDKNGKEIYEGDIIKPLIPNEAFGPGEIVYLAPGFAWKPIGTRYGFSLPQFDDRYPDPVYEIIGNIYENPELLK